MNDFHYQPSLIVGLGGGGIRTLRYIESIAESQDPTLRTSIKDHIQLVGLDLDEVSNMAEAKRDVQAIQNSAVAHEPIPDELKRLSRNWMLFSSEDLNRNLEKIWDGLRCSQSVPEYAARFESFKSWLPTLDQDAKRERFFSGNGSGGWRFKGRLAYFLNISNIASTFRLALQKVNGSNHLKAQPTAYIVCSLAGGTGSGMFWDVAITLKCLDPHLKIVGVFMLNQPFHGLGDGSNINANVYASLKELQSQADWLERTPIEYKGAQDGRLSRVLLDRAVFDAVYVTQGFPQGKTTNEDQIAILDATCFRLAHLVRAFCRHDLESKVRQEGDNLFQLHPAGDDQQKNLFKTAGSLWLPPLDKKIFVKAILHQFFDQLEPSSFKDLNISANELLHKLNLTGGEETWRTLFHELAKQETYDDHLKWKASGNAEQENPATRKALDAKTSILDRIKDKARELSLVAKQNIDDFKDADQNYHDLRKRLNKLDDLFVSDFASEMILGKTNGDGRVALVLDDSYLSKPFQAIWENRFKSFLDFEAEILQEKHFKGEVLHTVISAINTVIEVDKLFMKQKDFPPGVGVELRPMPDFSKVDRSDAGKSNKSKTVDLYLPGTSSIFKIKTIQMIYERLSNLTPGDIHLPNRPFYNVVIRSWTITKEKIINSLKKIKSHVEICIETDRRHARNVDYYIDFRNNKRSFITNPRNVDQIALMDFLKVIYNKYARTSQSWAEKLSEALLPLLEQELKDVSRKFNINKHFKADQNGIELEARDSEESEESGRLELSERSCLNSLVLLGDYAVNTVENKMRNDKDSDTNTNVFNRLLRFVFGCLDPRFDHVFKGHNFDRVLEQPKPDFEDWLNNRFEILKKATDQALDALSSQGVFSMLTGLAVDELEGRLKGVKPDAFESSTFGHQRSKLLAFPFVNNSTKTLSRREIDEASELIETAARNAFQARAHVFESETSKPMVFFYDLDKPAESIVDIDNLHHDYRLKAVKKEHHLFHIDHNLTRLPEAAAPSCQTKAVCGNDTCDFDIRGIERSTTMCPKCRNPILNRCGNMSCREDQLHEYIQIYREQNEGKIPYNCPSCHQELRTYWWSCEDRNHQRKIPMDKESCPECLRETQTGKRLKKDVTSRPDRSERMACMGCRVISDDPNDWFMVHSSIKDYVEDGVNGHDSADFLTKIKVFQPSHKTVKPHECPNPKDLDNHALIPTCPHGQDSDTERHYLYRISDNRFACARHVDYQFHNCIACNYPIKTGQDTAKCQRCHTDLYHCIYCSDSHRHYVQQSDTHKGRCDHCLNPIKSLEDSTLSSADDMTDPGVCSNIYGCIAGRDILEVHTDQKNRKCSACSSQAAPLITPDIRNHWLDKCFVCRLVVYPSVDKIEDLKVHAVEFIRNILKDGHDVHGDCRICGSETSKNFNFFWETLEDTVLAGPTNVDQAILTTDEFNRFKNEFETHRSKIRKTPKIDWKQLEVIKILKTLHKEQNDELAFDQIEREIIRNYSSIREVPRFRDIIVLFKRGGKVRSNLEKRLKKLDSELMVIAQVAKDWGGESLEN
jgi:hypothetical protein